MHEGAGKSILGSCGNTNRGTKATNLANKKHERYKEKKFKILKNNLTNPLRMFLSFTKSSAFFSFGNFSECSLSKCYISVNFFNLAKC